jgi:hypothetical protein
VDVLTSNPLYLYSAAGVPVALLLLFILSSVFGGKKVRLFCQSGNPTYR